MTDPDVDYVLCIPTDRDPPAPSLAVTCDACGTAVWLSHETRNELRRIHPASRLVPVCIACGVALAGDADAEIEITPSQRRRLRP